ncbi:phosphoglucosamine mutase [Parenemella sanctibonifatiensis]|uniref:Phosphoglucosamine mutase n=1 Tax=Parenemella sanctibonifatiensis TaxID=2016505 RepID=A0A255E7T9_9ACTN|nr:phosphoglucosamine mutase [Parenemella sanctibonifatiensis]OYN87604.1 phosphoglucosamine mutase [Parenemella sanctibonifatiensis]
MPRLFGTDGVRGRANSVDLSAEMAMSLAVASAHVLGEAGQLDGRPTALVGRDPRISGEFLESAVVAGLASAGVDVVRIGIVPTPGLAYLTGALDADFAVMLSASHNPMPDNGIKIFSRGGVKLDDALEDAIEARLDVEWERPQGAQVGRVTDAPGAVEQYVAHLVGSLGKDGDDSVSLNGISVVVDAANGAAYRTAVDAFSAQGAEVLPINASPDGLNINEHCGSTHPEELQRAVVDNRADLGIALDGDADRCLAVDHEGNLIDGDQILAVLALGMKERGRLVRDTVVATVMSNLGFVQAMRAQGLRVEQTKVGDRYVLEAMNAEGYTLGGEQSGHVVMSEFATTGDGVLTGLHLMARIAQTKSPLKELASVMTRLPQVLINVPGVDKTRVNIDPGVLAAVRGAAEALSETGRVLLRPSGTEPLVRVMVEAPTDAEARRHAEDLAAVVRERLSL